MNYFVTTSIPYVNAEPHIGFGMELVMADVLARYARAHKTPVIFSTGTDEHGGKIIEKLVQKLGMIDDAMDQKPFSPLMVELSSRPRLGKGRAFECFTSPRHEIMGHGPAASLAAGLGDRPCDAPPGSHPWRERAGLRARRREPLEEPALEILRVIFPHRVVADLGDKR